MFIQKDSSSLSQFTCFISLSLIISKALAVYLNHKVDFFLIANLMMQAVFSSLILFCSIYYSKKAVKTKIN